jgi:hypothetical protein
MRSTRRLLAAAAVVAAALVPGLAAESSAAAASATTTFKGRFVCGDRPLAGAEVQLVGVPRETPIFFGLFGTAQGVVATLPTHKAGPDGDWSFTVPQTRDTNYYVEVSLDDESGTRVVDYSSGTTASSRTEGTNFNDRDVQDYHTQSYGGPECVLWLALRDAYQDYIKLMAKRPPYGDLVAEYGALNDGAPYTAYTTIVWPRGYPADAAAVRHEFAHTIRNASLGSEARFLDEVSQGDFRSPHDPCRQTTTQYAFHEGWAEFWAGDFHPAPLCHGDEETHDPAVEGAVGWELTRLEHTCAGASRRRMVQILLDRGPTIHSLADFSRALGVGPTTCQGTPLEPGDVPSYRVLPPVSDDLWLRDLRAGLTSARHRESALRKLLPGANRTAVSARCPNPPCTVAIGRKVTPDLIRGQLAQARLLAETLSAEVSPKARAELVEQPTRAFLERVTTLPRTLARRLARAGLDSVEKALAAARPLASRDRSAATRLLVSSLAFQRTQLAHAARSGIGLTPSALPGTVTPVARAVPTRHLVTFDGLGEGSVVTSTGGATFGSPSTLGFHANAPVYVCQTAPTAAQGAAVAPACSGPESGFVYAGTMVRLVSPARSVTARVGATQAVPGGLPVEIDGFDAAGHLVGRTAALVGSSTNDQGAGAVTQLKVTVPRRAQPAAFVAIFVNTPIASGSPARLVFDDLGFTE